MYFKKSTSSQSYFMFMINYFLANKEAIQCLEECLKINPKNANTYQYKGLIINYFS